MQKKLVFIPVSSAEAGLVARGEPLATRPAFAVTDELITALGYGNDLIEDAEYAAMLIASVSGLSAHGERIVLVAEVDEASTGEVVDAENGELVLTRLDPGAVTAFFCDDTGVDCSPAAEAAAGLGTDQAWEKYEVQELLNSSDLLWHSAEELRGITKG